MAGELIAGGGGLARHWETVREAIEGERAGQASQEGEE
jgi:hypothetical protein